MPEQVGKIIRIKNKFEGPTTLVVNTVGEGLRKHINLCGACSKFKPNRAGHCQIAQDMYEDNRADGIAVAIVRCAEFEPNKGVVVHEAGAGHAADAQ